MTLQNYYNISFILCPHTIHIKGVGKTDFLMIQSGEKGGIALDCYMKVWYTEKKSFGNVGAQTKLLFMEKADLDKDIVKEK